MLATILYSEENNPELLCYSNKHLRNDFLSCPSVLGSRAAIQAVSETKFGLAHICVGIAEQDVRL